MYQKGGLVLLNPQIKEFAPQPIWDMLVSFDELNEARARANSKSNNPKQFVFGNNTYIHIPGTETFTIPNATLDEEGNPMETFTPLQIMTENFAATKSLRQRITPVKSAEMMLWLGDSARFKIIRAVQLHNLEPPVTSETNTYTPFFQFLSEGVEDHWTVQQQYSSCKWAASQNEALATSMLLHYGWVPRYTERMKGCAIYQLRRGDDGIHLTFSEPHTYQSRMDAACLRAREISDAFTAKNRHAPFELIFKEACRVFFSFNHFYISISAAYRQTALNKIRAFCEHLQNAFRETDKIVIPELPQPDPEIDGVIEVKYKDDAPVEYILKWEDFIIGGQSEAQVEKLREIGKMRNKNTVTSVLEPGRLYTRPELLALMSKDSLYRAINHETLVVDHKVGRKAFYRLNLESDNERS